MKKILYLCLLSFIGYYWILFYRFCHPYPKFEYFLVIWIQFGISFLAYLFSDRVGRIITIISGLTLVRLGPILGVQSPIITLMGVFLGGTFGILVREVFFYFRKQERKSLNEDNSMYSLLDYPKFILILFLLVLSLDRFLIYFDAPYLRKFGILETMYVPGVSSKEAFALSMESICNLLFPMLYFFAEEIYSKDKTKAVKDWKIGVAVALVIQFCILFLQILYNRNLLAENTNLSLEVNRVMGLFRDSGSATWIIPVLCFFMYEEILLKDKKFYFLLIVFILIQVFVGPYQGRGFWLIFLVGLCLLGFMLWKKMEWKISLRNALLFLVGFIVFVFILYHVPRMPNSSFDRLLSIPSKFISLIQVGENPILNIDPPRYYLNLSAWELFLQEPFFGNGIGSNIVNLKDTNLHFYIPDNKIDNPSFFLGTLSEIGIMGVLLLILYIAFQFYSLKNLFVIILLIPALSIGYHIVHPDGAFAIILVCIFWFGIQQEKKRTRVKVNILSIVIVILFFMHSMLEVFKQEKIPEFRKEKLHEYQLLAYERDKKMGDTQYYIFKGKTIWILAGAKDIQLEAFLDHSTSKNTLKQKWSILDKERNSISELKLTIRKNSSDLKLLKVPENAYYLQVEELNEYGKTQIYGDTPFGISVIHFTKKNEYF